MNELVLQAEWDDEASLLVASWDDPVGGGIVTQGKDMAELPQLETFISSP